LAAATTETAAAPEPKRQRDWQPWAAILLFILIFGLIALLGRERKDELGERTAGSGGPLTAEQRSVDFQAADLTFEVFPNKRAIKGRSILTLKVLKPIQRIQFDLDRKLPISAITADGQPVDKSRWSNPDGRAIVELGRTYNAGETLKLGVDYGGRPHVAKRAPWDGGFVWAHTPAGQPWIATAVEGEGCDLFWPCFDNSLVEIGTVDLHIIVPKGLVAPSNGRLLGVHDTADGRTRYDWRAKHPNNYAIALNIAPYKQISGTYRSRFGNVIPLDYWYLPGEDAQARELFAEFAPTLDFFEANIGPYPFGDEKVGVVETPHLGMEHQTINAYGNAYKKAPEGFDWLFQHEFSHEWFGNQLTNRDWDDMWLHEGFGTYMQPLYAQWRGGQIPYDAGLWKLRSQIRNAYPIVSGRHKLEDEVYDNETGPGLDIYYKAALILHSLRQLIGDEAFFTATRRMVYGRPDPKPGNFQPRFGSTPEFVAIASQEAHRDLRWFFNAYFYQARLPRLVATRNGNTLFLQWRTPKGIPFPMPLDVAVDGKTVTVPMTAGHGSVPLNGPNSHWVVDPQGKVLRQSDDMDRFAAWDKADKAKAKPKS
jgi:aminopeptidase N